MFGPDITTDDFIISLALFSPNSPTRERSIGVESENNMSLLFSIIDELELSILDTDSLRITFFRRYDDVDTYDFDLERDSSIFENF